MKSTSPYTSYLLFLQVYSVSDIEVVTKTRYEHLPVDHPARRKGRTPASQVSPALIFLTNIAHLRLNHIAHLPILSSFPSQLMSALGGEDGEQAASQGGLFGGIDDDAGESATDDQPEENVEDATQAGQRVSTFEEYLAASNPVLVRPQCIRTQKQTFKLSLWMSDAFPLSLRDQVSSRFEAFLSLVLSQESASPLPLFLCLL